jgi:hypothetical protein
MICVDVEDEKGRLKGEGGKMINWPPKGLELGEINECD